MGFWNIYSVNGKRVMTYITGQDYSQNIYLSCIVYSLVKSTKHTLQITKYLLVLHQKSPQCNKSKGNVVPCTNIYECNSQV